MTSTEIEIKNQNSRHFVQVPMPEWMFQAWIDYAVDIKTERKKIIEEFIDQYLITKKQYADQAERHVVLYASPAQSKPRSLWISEKHYQKVESFAKLHSNRSNRVIFTACLEGLIKKGRIQI